MSSEPAPVDRAGTPARARLPPTVVWLGVVSLLTDASGEMIYALLPQFLTASLHAGKGFVGVVEGIAEATLQYQDWAWLRRFSRGDGDQERYLEDLSRPGALTASLNWYRANLAPRMPGTAPELPPVRVPTLGIWSTNDHYLDGERMEKSAAFVQAPWRYEVIEGASHWVQLDAPDRVNELLLDWLAEPAAAG